MNFIDTYVKYASQQTEASRLFHYYMAYQLASIVVGRRCTVSYSDYGVGPNLWMVFVGPSSSAKKSSSWKIGVNLLEQHLRSQPLEKRLHIHNDGSYESWIEALDGMKNEAGEAQAYMVFDEYRSLHNWITRDYASPLEAVFTTAFDQSTLRRRVGTRDKAKLYVIDKPCLNIVAATTVAWFNKSITEKQILSGFIPRFNIIKGENSGTWIPRRPQPDLMLRDTLLGQIKQLSEAPVGDYTYTDKAGKLFDKWYIWMNEKMIPAFGEASTVAPCAHRRIADVHKYALLNALVRGEANRKMNEEDLDKAIEECVKPVLVATEEMISKEMAFDDYQERRLKVLQIIQTSSGSAGRAHRRDVMRLAKIDKLQFDRILESLEEEEAIKIEREKNSNGKLSLYYKIINDEDNARAAVADSQPD